MLSKIYKNKEFSSKMRFFASISYDGAEYSGWQIQPNAPSIQDEIQKALSVLFGEKIAVMGAGRTDTGVNAIGFIAHFDIGNDLILKEPEKVIYKINAILPKGITIHGFKHVKDDAHARFDAESRTYKYFIHRPKDPFMNRYSWNCRFPLDMDSMNEAAKFLLGRHDFSCFEKMHGNSSSPFCTITNAKWSAYTTSVSTRKDAELTSEANDYIVFTITANRFLRNMVRAIVGTLVEIGRGKRSPEWIREVMQSGDRCQAGQSVPGNALFLTDIRYPKDIFEIITE